MSIITCSRYRGEIESANTSIAMSNLASAAAQSDSMVARELNANAQTAPIVSLNAQHIALQNSPSAASWDEYRKWIEIKQTYLTYDQSPFMFDSKNPTQPQDTTSKLSPRVSFSSSNVTLAQSSFNIQRGTNQQTTTSNNNVTLAEAQSNLFGVQQQPQVNTAIANQQQQAPPAPAQTQPQLNANAVNQQRTQTNQIQSQLSQNVQQQPNAVLRPQQPTHKAQQIPQLFSTASPPVEQPGTSINQQAQLIQLVLQQLQDVSFFLFGQGSSARSNNNYKKQQIILFKIKFKIKWKKKKKKLDL